MIARIKNFFQAANELLFSRIGMTFTVFTLVYVFAISLFPMLFLVEVANALVFAFAIILAVMYIPDAIYVARNDKGEGGQYFLVGFSLVIVWLLESRAFSSVWRWMGNPDTWLNHPFNTFFLFLLAWGLFTLAAAPGMRGGEVPIKNWRVIGLAIAVAIFVFGVTIGLVFSGKIKEVAVPTTVAELRTQCAANQPIKGNVRGSRLIYHVPGGLSYDSTIPERCFATESEAEAQGFRRAGDSPEGRRSEKQSLTFARK
jgi:hypothetical protein